MASWSRTKTLQHNTIEWQAMLLTISTTYKPATDLGFLLHKNPSNLHTIKIAFGKAHVFFPEATNSRCTAALLLDIDPIGIARKTKQAQYVNDYPYASSSLMSVALNKAFRSAIAGRSKQRPELIGKNIPLEIKISALPYFNDELTPEQLFKPLGYEVKIERLPLDEKFPHWGESRYCTITLNRTCPVKEFLTHLYVLLPTLDNKKHYYISNDEVEKLLRFGSSWLDTHPEKNAITRRYLQFRDVINTAAKQFSIVANDETEKSEKKHEEKINLNTKRISTVIETLKSYNAKRIIDLGCGDGKLLKELLDDNYFEYITGCDVSLQALRRAGKKLYFDNLPPMQKKRISLMHAALTYRDKRFMGYDASILTEVIEHIDPINLNTLCRVIFEFASPALVIMTTPNAEYNTLFANLLDNNFRHSDHRFEWTREEFETWSKHAAKEFGYNVTFKHIGDLHEQYGAPTQMGVFTKNA